jgi:hypothetical protein
MIDHPALCARALKILAITGFLLLGGCIDSKQPILTGAQPVLGERLRIEFYVLRDGTAHEPEAETFVWRNGRYHPVRGAASDIHDFTLHPFEGGDLIVQSLRPDYPAEYGIARNLVDATYLHFAIDENDADAATRDKYCGKEADAACRVTTRDAVLAFARASAAKPHPVGGLAELMAGR